MDEETNISKLLRLKRYEQPPPGYFDNFLQEFHRRQRVELLRQSPWQAFWERLMSIAPTFRVPQFAYATIMVFGLAASVMIVGKPGGGVAKNGQVDSSQTAFSLTSSKPITMGIDAVPVATQLPPHYVLQPRPVSNEQPLSF